MSYKPEGSSVSSPYAALSASVTAPAREQAQSTDTLASLLHNTATPTYLIEEALRLEDLKGALWSAFKAAPETAIPMPLVDLASVYTNALRLQLSLISPAPAKARPTAEPGRLPARAKNDHPQSSL
jgi:hypothetical protein